MHKTAPIGKYINSDRQKTWINRLITSKILGQHYPKMRLSISITGFDFFGFIEISEYDVIE